MNVNFNNVVNRGNSSICMVNGVTYSDGELVHRHDCPLSQDSSALLNDRIEHRELKFDGAIFKLIVNTVVSVEVQKGERNLVALRAPGYLINMLSEGFESGELNLATSYHDVVKGRGEIGYLIQTKNPELLRSVLHKGFGDLTFLPEIGSNHAKTTIEAEADGDLTFRKSIRGKDITIKKTNRGDLNVNGFIETSSSSAGPYTGICFFSVSGIGNVRLETLGAQSLDVDISGESNMIVKSLASEQWLSLKNSGIGNVIVSDGVVCNTLQIRQSSYGCINCCGVNASSLVLNNLFRGSVTLSGSCGYGSVINSDTGKCNLRGLKTLRELDIARTDSSCMIQ